MNRRNFLKYLSSIPLIGIPAKVLAKERSDWNGIIESRSNVSLYKSKIDPYADVENLPWRYPMIVSGEEMNTDFGKITLNRGVKWLG